MNNNIICNGEMEIVKITEEMYDDAVKLFTDNFIQLENLCLATELPNSPQAVQDLQSACRRLLKDDISFAARNIENGELAAIAVNHLMSSQKESATLCNVMHILKSPEMECITAILESLETQSDIYNALQIDCVMEIVFLATSTKYTKRGLASILTEYSIGYARRLKADELSSHVQAQPELKPSAVCSIFTSLFTQRIGRKFAFEILAKVPYTECSFKGKTFAERIDPKHEGITFEVLRL